MLQTRIHAKVLAPLMEDSANVKHLPLSRVPILNYHLAYPNGPEPSQYLITTLLTQMVP